MMNKGFQEKILKIVKKAEDELVGSRWEKLFYKEALKTLLNSEYWNIAHNKIGGRAQEMINARRCEDAKQREKKNLEATEKE